MAPKRAPEQTEQQRAAQEEHEALVSRAIDCGVRCHSLSPFAHSPHRAHTRCLQTAQQPCTGHHRVYAPQIIASEPCRDQKGALPLCRGACTGAAFPTPASCAGLPGLLPIRLVMPAERTLPAALANADGRDIVKKSAARKNRHAAQLAMLQAVVLVGQILCPATMPVALSVPAPTLSAAFYRFKLAE